MTLHPVHSCSNFTSITFYTGTRLHLFPPPNRRRTHSRWALMASGPPAGAHRNREKLLVIMGATGAGKSRLSLDLAARFPAFEIVNSDKMQLYSGLDITTNKLPVADRRGVPHHLLGELDPLAYAVRDFSPADFRALAGGVVSEISSRKKVPMLVGGSNSFIHALLVDRFEPGSDVFGSGSDVSAVSSELRYDCCFLWVDVSLAVLTEYLWKRVDEMLDSGMLDELAEFCDPDRESGRTGLRKAIGVPEFTEYFKKYRRRDDAGGGVGGDRERRGAYEEAVRAIKDNTFHLAKRQIGKILRLRGGGWNLRRLEATEAFRAVVERAEDGGGERWSEIWERQVVEPSVKIVKLFLEE